VERIAAGERIALVSDAGVPGISDPGERVIRAAVERGLNVVAIPGPSAMISALVASGLHTGQFRFIGFLPARSGERRTALENLKEATETLIFYEAPHRILEMLADVQSILGSERQMVLARELTKVHEEMLRGTVGEILKELTSRPAVKGEMTVIVSGKAQSVQPQDQQHTLSSRMHQLINESSLDEKEALKQVAREFGLGKSEAYREWQRTKSASRGKMPDTQRKFRRTE
jgi:16S rRNA (cytidine1402-2'-O)-methyltransferase